MNKRQIEVEIKWLENKIKSLSSTKTKQIKDLERQIKERELNLHLGIEK
jgi:hypothetical protein